MKFDAEEFGIHWFRRDLRIAGNPALAWAQKRFQGRVLGIFCFDSKFLARDDFSHNRFAFFLNTLKSLKEELSLLGGDLLVIDTLPQEAISKILAVLKKQNNSPSAVSFNRDYEPYALKRDEELKKIISSYGIDVHTDADHLILEPHQVLKDTQDKNSFYKVFTPYAKKWLSVFELKEIQEKIVRQKFAFQYLENKNEKEIFHIKWNDVKKFSIYTDQLESFIKQNEKQTTIPIPKAGTQAAFKKLKEFKSKLDDYSVDRDFPAKPATSMLSVFLKNGSLTSSQIIYYLKLSKENGFTYLKEIIWREFYYSILYHVPSVERMAFNPKYQDLDWENDKSFFQRWKEGTTGFPIVDAGMRQLNQTGWMHNRVRMIVASFLTKDLLIDWRWGENYFMKTLLDGDLAPNNGGWQWAASTGCDPQPYFRIFNPWLQGAKFDPNADYIRQFVPELKNISDKNIHNPDGDRGKTYPLPMVNHAQRKINALRLFQK